MLRCIFRVYRSCRRNCRGSAECGANRHLTQRVSLSGGGGAMAEVTARQRAILMVIVEHYIETGEPVSSGMIAAQVAAHVGNLSPATVRNEMVALAEAGLLGAAAHFFRPDSDGACVSAVCRTPGCRPGAPGCRHTLAARLMRALPVWRGRRRCSEAHEPYPGHAFKRRGGGDCAGSGRRPAGACAFFPAGCPAGAGRGGDARRHGARPGAGA